MPTSLLSADSQFPDLKKEQSTDEKFEVVTNYLYMLLEQLRYTLGNLGLNNINESEFLKIGELITSPISIQLEGTEGQLAQLQITADGLNSRVSDAEGNVSQLAQTVDGLGARVANAEGNITSLTVTANGLTSRVSDAEGNISTVQQTINGLTVTDSSGTTRIKGSSIETGSLVLTGTITWDDLNSGVQSTINTASTNASTANTNASTALSTANAANSTANGAYTAANGAQVNLAMLANGQYSGGTFIDGKNLYAPNLYGNTISLMDPAGYQVGTMSLQYSSTFAFDLSSNLSLRLQAASGFNAYLGNGDAFFMCAYDSASGANLATIGGGMRVTNASYGYSLPTTGLQAGRVFFLLEG